MNKALRQLFTAVVALFVVLGLSTTIITAIKADDLNADSRNTRMLYHTIGAPRGAILASDGTVLAQSDPVNDPFSYQRTYSNGPVYAPVTGYFSITHGVDRGIEASRNEQLNGQADSLFWQQLKDTFTGNQSQGASVETSIDPTLQQLAYQLLDGKEGAIIASDPKTGRILAMASTPSYDPNQLAVHDGNQANQAAYQLLDGKEGAIIASDPKTGRILAMASTPSYDPNQLAVHDGNQANQAYTDLVSQPTNPMLNRATSQLFPPGSTFKVIVAAAALESGDYQPDTEIPAGASYTLPGTSTDLTNATAAGNGTDGKITLQDALAQSSNTAFAQLGVSLGADSIRDMAENLGYDDQILIDGSTATGSPTYAAASSFPEDPTDDRLALASIGQGDTLSTPLQNLMVAMAVANDGTLMEPTIVDRVRASDLSVISDASIGQGDTLSTPLQNLMVAMAVANDGTLMEPTIVDRVRASDLSVISETYPHKMSEAFSADTANKLTQMMEQVIPAENPSLAIDGVSIAAKTGTAQIGESNEANDAWTIGFAPADDPQIAVSVVVHNVNDYGAHAAGPFAPADDPQIAVSVVVHNVNDYGAHAAGPLMRAMMQEALKQ